MSRTSALATEAVIPIARMNTDDPMVTGIVLAGQISRTIRARGCGSYLFFDAGTLDVWCVADDRLVLQAMLKQPLWERRLLRHCTERSPARELAEELVAALATE